MKEPHRELPVELLDAAVEMLGRAGGHGRVRVQGASMMPTLEAGQTLAVEFSPARIGRGDLLVFRQANYLVVHRLLGRTRFPDGRPSLRTRGDGKIGLDPHVAPDRVLGRVTAVQGRDGWWDVRSPAARGYARMVALHDLFWAAVGAVAYLGDRAFRRLRIRTRLRDWAERVDRALLRLAHRALFRLAHSRVRLPEFRDVGGQPGPE